MAIAGLRPRDILIAVALAVAARGSCLGLVEVRYDGGDAASYLATAKTLSEQGVYSKDREAPFAPSAYRPPGYPTFLALVNRAGTGIGWVLFAQFILSILSALLAASLAARFLPAAGRIALFLAAANPFDAIYSIAALSECLTSFLVLLAAWCLARGPSRQWLALGGVSIGLLCLTRDIYLALVPFGALSWVLVGRRGERASRVRQAVTVALCAMLAVLPWTIRNALHFGRLIPVSEGRLGYSLWLGTWATNGAFTANDALGLEREYPAEAFLSQGEREMVARASPDLAKADAQFRSLALTRVASEPIRVLGVWLRRLPRLWFATRFDIFDLDPSLLPRGSVAWVGVKAALFLLDTVLVLLAVAGLVAASRSGSGVVWAGVPLLFTSLVYLPLNAFESRYSQPMVLLLVELSAYFIATWREDRRLRRLQVGSSAS